MMVPSKHPLEGQLVYHRDNGFDGQYRDNYFCITGPEYISNNQPYWPCITYGFKQYDKQTHELKYDTFNLDRPRNSGYHTSAKLELATDKANERIVRNKEAKPCKHCGRSG